MRDTMRLPCPRCGTQIERTGAAFATAKQFRCTSCGECIKLGYMEKLKLFEQARRSCDR
jgi:transposase-like protein